MANKYNPQTTVFSGPVNWSNAETDGIIQVPSFDGFSFDVGTWTFTRNAGGNYAMVKTAAANTSHPTINLALCLQKYGTDPLTAAPVPNTHAIRGVQLTGFDVIYSVATANLTAHTVNLYETSFTNNAAVSPVSGMGGTQTGTLATATQTNPYVTNISLGTPYVIGANTADTCDYLELTVNAASSTVYSLYGVILYVNYLLD